MRGREVALLVGLFWLTVAGQTGVHKRFEYKYSFKPPYLAQKDGTVPFFEYSGSKTHLFISVSLVMNWLFFAIC